MPADHRIPFALGSDGRAASIREVLRGLACRCTCPACGARLVARKGPVQAHNFAHEKGADCANALESSLHLAVKTILEEERRMRVPDCIVVRTPGGCQPAMYRYDIPRVEPFFYVDRLDEGWAKLVVPGVAGTSSKELKFEDVMVERQQGDIRPDLIGVQGDRRIYIEVAVTHRVDHEKLIKIRARRTAALEIRVPFDRFSQISWEDLRTLVVEQTTGKVWLYHPILETRAEQHFELMAPVREAAVRKVERERKRAEERHRRRAEHRAAQSAVRLAAQHAERMRIQAEEEARRLQVQAELEAKRNDPVYQQQLREEEATRSERITALLEAAEAERVRERHAQQAARDADIRAAEAQEQAARQKLDEQKAAERTILLARLRHGTPSNAQPIDAHALFLDMDGALEAGTVRFSQNLDLLCRALRDTPCSVVITSISRISPGMDTVTKLLAPLGGRRLDATPTLGIHDQYQVRTREIATWLQKHPEAKVLVVNSAPCGSWPGWIVHVVPPDRGLVESDITLIRRWLAS